MNAYTYVKKWKYFFKIHQRTYFSFLLLQHVSLTHVVTTPKSFCGPNRAQHVVKNPKAQNSENPRVVTMKIPNWKKKVILAPKRKQDEPHVVIAPDSTEIPT